MRCPSRPSTDSLAVARQAGYRAGRNNVHTAGKEFYWASGVEIVEWYNGWRVGWAEYRAEEAAKLVDPRESQPFTEARKLSVDRRDEYLRRKSA